jgi:hypothetical protein
MADIFDEVDEDIKRDHMQALWARYGKIAITVIATVVLSVALRQGYVAWQNSKSESSATAYHQAVISDNVVMALQSTVSSLNSGYAMLAQFQIAAEQAAGKNVLAAEATYLALASDESIQPLYQQAAILLSVMVASKEADATSMIERLRNLEISPGPWQAMALETGAGLALRTDSKDAALKKYKMIVEMTDISVGMRQRAERMVVMLSSNLLD